MDLSDTLTPDGTPVVNYTFSDHPAPVGDKFCMMVCVRKIVHLHSRVYRMTVKKAKDKHGHTRTYDTLRKEVAQMVSKDVWDPELWETLTYDEKRAVIASSIFLKEKFLADGSFDKLKARLVAGGHMQDRRVYSLEETSSPTASTTAIFLVAAIAAKERRHVVTLDYSGAYLNAKMHKTVRMLLDKDLAEVLCQVDPKYRRYLRADGKLLVKLKKALYGCVESAKLWYDLCKSGLESLGFEENPYEPCVFNKYVSGRQVSIALYVDDLMVTCTDERILNDVIQSLGQLFDGATMHSGPVHSYVGMLFDFTDPGQVHIRMDGYIEDFLQDYGVTGVAATPAASDLFEVDLNAEELDMETSDIFHSRVAKILYLAKRSRPDLITTTSFLATRVQSPTTQDMNKLQRLLKYINGTRDLWLTLEADDDWGLFAYIDASYGTHPDGKSHSGICMLLGKGCLYVQSTKQKLVSKSSTEAEIIAVSDGLSEVLWVRNFLLHQGVDLGPAIIYQDNMSTMALIEKGRSTSSRTRHINIRYFFVKDRVQSGEVVIKHMPTDQMLADLLTKPIQGYLFRRLRAKILHLKEQTVE